MDEDRQGDPEPSETPTSRGRAQELLPSEACAGVRVCRTHLVTPPHSYSGTEVLDPDISPQHTECSQGKLGQPCFSRHSNSVCGRLMKTTVLGTTWKMQQVGRPLMTALFPLQMRQPGPCSLKVSLAVLARGLGHLFCWWCLAELMVHLMYMHALYGSAPLLGAVSPWTLGNGTTSLTGWLRRGAGLGAGEGAVGAGTPSQGGAGQALRSGSPGWERSPSVTERD